MKRAVRAIAFFSLAVSVPAIQTRAAGPATTRPDNHFTGTHSVRLPATYGGRSGVFCVDTGAYITVVDLLSFRDLPEAPAIGDVTGFGRTVNLLGCQPPSMQVGPFGLGAGKPIGRRDLSDLRSVLGTDVMGILGRPEMAVGVFQLDFDRHTCALLPPAARPDHDWGEALPTTKGDDGCLNVHVEVDGRDLLCCVDSGNDDSISLPAADYDMLPAGERGRAATANVVTFGEINTAEPVCRVASVRLGGRAYRDVLVNRVKGDSRCVGLGLLARNRVTIDFAGPHVYLKPRADPGPRDELDMSGLHLLRPLTDVNVSSVDPGSPAARAGLAAGDVVWQVNGRDVAQLDMDDVRDALRAGDGVRVTVRTAKVGGGYVDHVIVLKRRV